MRIFDDAVRSAVATERWYTGRITVLETSGYYQVWVHELNVVYPRVARSGPDRRRLLPGDRVVLRQRGLLLEIV